MSIYKLLTLGHVEPAHVSEFQFENQRRTFASFGYALDPSVSIDEQGLTKVIGSTEETNDSNIKTVFEKTQLRPLDKRKRQKNDNPDDVEGFLGPWGGFEGEQRVMRPTEEEQAELQELVSKRTKRGREPEERHIEEKSVLHIKDALDYQGRSFLHAPHDVGVNLKSGKVKMQNIQNWCCNTLLQMHPRISVSCQSPISIHGLDIPRESRQYVGFQKLLIYFYRAAWIVKLKYGKSIRKDVA